jgi:hypothetical protein
MEPQAKSEARRLGGGGYDQQTEAKGHAHLRGGRRKMNWSGSTVRVRAERLDLVEVVAIESRRLKAMPICA